MTVFLLIIALSGPVIALCFGTHAGWTWLAGAYSAPVASGAVALAYAMLSSVAAAIVLYRKQKRSSAVKASGPLAVVEEAMRRNPLQATAALVGLGALLAKKPKLALLAVSKAATVK